MKLENKNILIISGEPWGLIWYSKHNYAWQLSKKNKVFFINPPRRFSIFNIFRANLEENIISPSLTVLTYKNILPLKYKWLWKLNENYVFKKLRQYFESKKPSELIFWTFDPIRLAFPEILSPKQIIVHAVDHYLFTYPSETILCAKADYVFCVSKEVQEAFSKYSLKTHLIPHAIPSDEFLPAKSKTSNKLVGIFAGTLDLRIDYPYLQFIIEKFPDITFKFVGKIQIDNSFTKQLLKGDFKNTIVEGEKPFEEVKYYIQNADFCILFKDNTVSGNSISSHKMLQYLAQGKPIFCTELSQHKEIEDLLFMSNDMYKMEKLLRTFVLNGDSQTNISKRIVYASRHSFDTTLKKIETILE